MVTLTIQNYKVSSILTFLGAELSLHDTTTPYMMQCLDDKHQVPGLDHHTPKRVDNH